MKQDRLVSYTGRRLRRGVPKKIMPLHFDWNPMAAKSDWIFATTNTEYKNYALQRLCSNCFLPGVKKSKFLKMC